MLRGGSTARSLRNTLFIVESLQNMEELPQMILRLLSRNILRHLSIFYGSLIKISGKSNLEIELKYNSEDVYL
ncbi:hypothetical protein COL00_14320 [Bacillus cereus]|nr:hypothetical protein COL00_14320 [Bacillus cereus]